MSKTRSRTISSAPIDSVRKFNELTVAMLNGVEPSVVNTTGVPSLSSRPSVLCCHVASSASHMGGANEMQCMTTDAPENQGQMAWALDQPTFAQPDQGYVDTHRPDDETCTRPRGLLFSTVRASMCPVCATSGAALWRAGQYGQGERETASGK